MQRQVKGLLPTYVHGDSGLYFGIETRSAYSDLVVSGEQVHRGIEAIGVCGDRSLDAGGHVLNHDLCLSYGSAGRIGDGAGQSSAGDLRTYRSRKENYTYQEHCW